MPEFMVLVFFVLLVFVCWNVLAPRRRYRPPCRRLRCVSGRDEPLSERPVPPEAVHGSPQAVLGLDLLASREAGLC